MANHNLGNRAEQNLQFIRDTMERSTRFTAVSGNGGILMGSVGLAAAGLAQLHFPDTRTWIVIWLGAAALAAPIGAWAMLRKSRRSGMPLAGVPARKFALCFFPVVVAGVVLTWTLIRSAPDVLPAAWLSLYGAAVMAGGAFSVPALPVMGACFLALGAVAGLFPATGNLTLMLGFGVLQIGFGVHIRERYDG